MRYLYVCLQRAAEETAKSFPACWHAGRTRQGSVDRGSKSSESTVSSGTESQSTSDQFSPKSVSVSSDVSPGSAANCLTVCDPPLQSIAATESRFTVGELTTSSNPSTSSRKLNLEDYKRRLSVKSSVIPVDSSHSSLTVAAERQESHRSLLRRSKSEVSSSSLLASGAKPRIKLKIGSEVVFNSVISPGKLSADVSAGGVTQNTTGNDTGLSGQNAADVPDDCVNEESNLLNSLSAKTAGYALFSGSSDDENGNSEPPLKRARVSFS